MAAKNAPDAPAATAPAVKVHAAASKLLAQKSREPAYTVTPGAPRVKVSDGIYMTRGTRSKAPFTPSLVRVDGSSQSGLALADVHAAIHGGAIPRADIETLWADADAV